MPVGTVPERMAAEMLDQGVDDLEKPVDEIEAQAGGDAFKVAFAVFVGCKHRSPAPAG